MRTQVGREGGLVEADGEDEDFFEHGELDSGYWLLVASD